MTDTVESRVEKLERANRKLWIVLLLTIALSGGVLFMRHAATPGVSDLTTKSLAVVDAAGKPRMALGVEKGVSGLFFYDEALHMRAGLAVLKDGPELSLYDKAGIMMIRLNAAEHGPGLDFYDEAKHLRASLSVTKYGPTVLLGDAAGKPRVALRISEDGPELSLLDRGGKTRASLSLLKEEPVLVLADEAGKARVEIAVAADGPGVSLEDTEGFEATLGATALVTPKTGTQTKRSAASLVMFDKEKKVLWEAP